MDKDIGIMEFYYQFEDNAPVISVSLSPHSTLSEACEAFEQFLRASGYVFEGNVVIYQEAGEDLQDPKADFN